MSNLPDETPSPETEPVTEYLTKAEAYTELNITERTLDRYVQKDRIIAHSAGGRRVKFLRADVEQLKQEMMQTTRPDTDTTALSVTKRHLPTTRQTDALVGLSDVITASVERAVTTAMTAKPSVSLTEKLTLSVDEASTVSGIGKTIIREAIKDGELRAGKWGRGWRIKKSDLNKWIDLL